MRTSPANYLSLDYRYTAAGLEGQLSLLLTSPPSLSLVYWYIEARLARNPAPPSERRREAQQWIGDVGRKESGAETPYDRG